MNSIPVSRPIDYASVGTGEVYGKSNILIGSDTRFLTELSLGYTVEVKGTEVIIISILSDTQAECSGTVTEQISPFKILPKLNHSEMFSKVLSKLSKGYCVGICPEGKTHETPGVTKFKNGAAGIIYTALKQNIDLQVVAIGINYSMPDNNRTNAVAGLSKVLEIGNDIMQLDEKSAIKKITEKIQNEVKKLVVPMKNYDEVKLVYFTEKSFFQSHDDRVGRWREISQKFNEFRVDNQKKFEGVVESFEKFRDVVMDLGVSKYFDEKVSFLKYCSMLLICFIILAIVRII